MSSSPRTELATAEIRLQGQSQVGGVASVRSTLASIHGVRAVTVSLDIQEANVHFDLHKVNPLQFKRALFIIGMTIDTITLTFDQEAPLHAIDHEHGPWPSAGSR